MMLRMTGCQKHLKELKRTALRAANDVLTVFGHRQKCTSRGLNLHNFTALAALKIARDVTEGMATRTVNDTGP
jgi:hypothetical protein